MAMSRPHIERLRIQNYGCIKDVSLELTSFHALIGPNDSGKSTALMALRTLTTLAAGPLGNIDDRDRLIAAIHGNPHFAFEVALGGNTTWQLSSQPHSLMEKMLESDAERRSLHLDAGSQLLNSQAHRRVIAGSQLLRLEPDALRRATELIPEGRPLRFANSLGLGLPAIYDAIVTHDRHAEFHRAREGICPRRALGQLRRRRGRGSALHRA